MKLFRLRWAAVLVAFILLGPQSVMAQEIDWEDAVRQIRSKEAAEEAARDASRRMLRDKMETAQMEREQQDSIRSASRLSEWMRNDLSPPQEPAKYWPLIAMLATSVPIMWAIWRSWRRIIDWIENTIVAAGASIIKMCRTVRTSIARIRQRIVDRAGE